MWWICRGGGLFAGRSLSCVPAASAHRPPAKAQHKERASAHPINDTRARRCRSNAPRCRGGRVSGASSNRCPAAPRLSEGGRSPAAAVPPRKATSTTPAATPRADRPACATWQVPNTTTASRSAHSSAASNKFCTVEPVFDRAGRHIAWLRGDVIYDAQGRVLGWVRGDRLLSRRGRIVGFLRDGYFRDSRGDAVAFFGDPRFGPLLPIRGIPPIPPIPQIPPVPPIPGVAPIWPIPTLMWSRYNLLELFT
ncbi:4-fold beta flower protein [Microbacterium kribbense]|uniref:4-fold beta flower protein n=1 Tax=Microbacterium kribbense TaxID=433645 RepID=UPI003CD0B5DD